MKQQLVPLLGVILGIVVGWLLNQLSQWYKVEKEDNRIRKEVLFYLLEFRHLLSQLNITEVLNAVYSKLENKIPKELQSNEYKTLMNNTIKPLMLTLIKKQINDQLSEIKSEFRKAVSKLATVDPMQAYRLSNQDQVFQHGNIITEMFEKTTTENNDYAKKIIEYINTGVFIQSEEVLDELIENLAKSINRDTWAKAKLSLDRIRNKIDDPKFDKVLNDYIENIELNT